MSQESPEVRVGARFRTVFARNPKDASEFLWRATHIGEQRAPKVVLSNDPAIRAGVAAEVRVIAIRKPKARRRGSIEVEHVRDVEFELDEGVYVPALLKLKLQALLEWERNVLLDGPQGSGKTVLAREVARALDLEYVFFNCSAVFEATDFLATMQLRATSGGGVETVWVETDILRAFERARQEPKRRFLVFLDEFNRCREMARNGIMPALDSTRRMYNPVNGHIEPIPDNVLWIAAVNNGDQFSGTTAVDPAQLDRFAPVKVDYPPEDDETRILQGRYPTVPARLVRRVVQLANRVRKDKGLAVDLSMRATDEVVALLSHPNFSEYDGDPVPDLLRDSFCARLPGHWDDESSEAGLAWQLVSGTRR